MRKCELSMCTITIMLVFKRVSIVSILGYLCDGVKSMCLGWCNDEFRKVTFSLLVWKHVQISCTFSLVYSIQLSSSYMKYLIRDNTPSLCGIIVHDWSPVKECMGNKTLSSPPHPRTRDNTHWNVPWWSLIELWLKCCARAW